MKKILLFIVIMFLFGEGFLRTFYPQSQYSITYADWGWRHIPNSQVTFWGERPDWRWKLRPPVKIEYNNKGLRGPSIKMSDFENKFKVLILGDSFAEDMGSIFDNLHSTYLWEKLYLNMATPRSPIVLNAGHYAYSTAQELMYYIAEGQKYKPDIVIIFHAVDRDNSKYAELKDGELVLKWQVFTRPQKLYRKIVSWIRLHSHLGSLILNDLHKMPSFRKVATRQGLSDAIPVVSLDTKPIETITSFSPIDIKIWRTFKALTQSNNSKLIIMNCIGEFTQAQRAFFNEEDILHFGITNLPNANKRREADKRNGCYDPSLESHRFGYKNNRLVGDKIYEFLKENNLLNE